MHGLSARKMKETFIFVHKVAGKRIEKGKNNTVTT
jgi:hypothetical protein